MKILISYRREDTSGYAGRLYDDLSEVYGKGQVFIDIDAIEPGVDFTEVIAREVGSSDVVLVLIGPRWLTLADGEGNRRLDNPEDYHRLEIEAALQRDIRVIPLLFQGAAMPNRDQLPEPIRKLAVRNALEITDQRWAFDLGRLTEALTRVLEGSGDAATARPRHGRPSPQAARRPSERAASPARSTQTIPTARSRRLVIGSVALVVLLVAGVLGWQLFRSEKAPGSPGGGASPSASGAAVPVGDSVLVQLAWHGPPDDLDMWIATPGGVSGGVYEAGDAEHSGDSKGPDAQETVVIDLSAPSPMWAGEYEIHVDNFTCEKEISDSDAVITIRSGDREVAEIGVPTADGKRWTVGTLTLSADRDASFVADGSVEEICASG